MTANGTIFLPGTAMQNVNEYGSIQNASGSNIGMAYQGIQIVADSNVAPA